MKTSLKGYNQGFNISFEKIKYITSTYRNELICHHFSSRKPIHMFKKVITDIHDMFIIADPNNNDQFIATMQTAIDLLLNNDITWNDFFYANYLISGITNDDKFIAIFKKVFFLIL